jgi:hypothetical protein
VVCEPAPVQLFAKSRAFSFFDFARFLGQQVISPASKRL